MASAKTRIVGFNTVDVAPGTTGFSLYDRDIAVRDLLNTFHTEKGSRVMLPEFGSNIYSYVFENLTDAVKDEIVDDAKSVVESDPRFTLSYVDVDQDDHGITVKMDLIYNPDGMTVSLAVDFENKTKGNV